MPEDGGVQYLKKPESKVWPKILHIVKLVLIKYKLTLLNSQKLKKHNSSDNNSSLKISLGRNPVNQEGSQTLKLSVKEVNGKKKKTGGEILIHLNINQKQLWDYGIKCKWHQNILLKNRNCPQIGTCSQQNIDSRCLIALTILLSLEGCVRGDYVL